MRKKLFILILILTLTFPTAVMAKSPEKGEGMGNISAFTGDVMVRTNGRWSRLEKIPHIIYSSDKVVTNRGRAEITFHDGDVLRLNLDSNISFNQDEKKDIVSRKVNILLGKLWFDVKPKKDGAKIEFRTPTITAGIRGTEGLFNVNLDGSTDFGLMTGNVDIEGKYNKIDNPQAISSDDVNTEPGNLPMSESSKSESEIQKTAIRSFQRYRAAIRALNDAKSRINLTKKNDIVSQALEAAAIAEAASAAATANILSSQEVIAEAERLGDNNKIRKAFEILDRIEVIADIATNSAQEASRMAERALSAVTDQERQAYGFAALAYASAVESSASASSAAVNIAEISVSDDDPQRVSLAEKEVEKAKNYAEKAGDAADKANYAALKSDVSTAKKNMELAKKYAEEAKLCADITAELSKKKYDSYETFTMDPFPLEDILPNDDIVASPI